jgi:hypothetical protein
MVALPDSGNTAVWAFGRGLDIATKAKRQVADAIGRAEAKAVVEPGMSSYPPTCCGADDPGSAPSPGRCAASNWRGVGLAAAMRTPAGSPARELSPSNWSNSFDAF